MSALSPRSRGQRLAERARAVSGGEPPPQAGKQSPRATLTPRSPAQAAESTLGPRARATRLAASGANTANSNRKRSRAQPTDDTEDQQPPMSAAAARQRDAYLARIAEVKAEISEKRRRLAGSKRKRKRLLSSTSNLQQIMSHLLHVSNQYQRTETQQSNRADEEVDLDLEATQLRVLAGITGIEFNEASSQVLPPRPNGSRHRLYSLSGSCGGLAFSLSIDVSETRSMVSSMQVGLPPEVLGELQDFAATVEASRSPLVFFRGLSQYSEWRRQRQALFAKLTKDYPDVTTMPAGAQHATVLTIHNPDLPAFGVSLSWRIVMGRTGQAVCDVTASPRVSESFAKEDVLGLARRLPSQFQSLVRLRGLEDAVDALVRFVADKV
eukprot:m.94121 g.94121  ORF g.94121 m.94121 type:complete len:382 (-) comp15112_c0_seq2:91-1236(-)